MVKSTDLIHGDVIVLGAKDQSWYRFAKVESVNVGNKVTIKTSGFGDISTTKKATHVVLQPRPREE